MEIVLIRHAEAEDPVPETGDFNRPLTRQGQRDALALSLLLPDLLRKPLVLWFSPLLRARQTAEYLVPSLFPVEARSCDAIAEGDLLALQQKWKSLAAETLVLVGHQPHMGQWIRELSGVDLPVSKASCTILRERPGKEKCQFLWHARPEMVARMAGGEESAAHGDHGRML